MQTQTGCLQVELVQCRLVIPNPFPAPHGGHPVPSGFEPLVVLEPIILCKLVDLSKQIIGSHLVQSVRCSGGDPHPNPSGRAKAQDGQQGKDHPDQDQIDPGECGTIGDDDLPKEIDETEDRPQQDRRHQDPETRTAPVQQGSLMEPPEDQTREKGKNQDHHEEAVVG